MALALPCPSDGLSPGAQEGTLQGSLHPKELGLGAGGGSMPLAGLRWALPLRSLPPPSPLPRGRPLGSRRVAGGLRSCTVACCWQDSEKACEEVTFLSGFPDLSPPPGVRPVLKSRSGQRRAREGGWAPQMREAGACSLHFGTRQMFSEFSLNMALFSYLLLGQVCKGMKSKIAFGAG